MLNKTQRVWLLAAILTGAVVQANAANIVADPGFEKGLTWLLHGGAYGRRLVCHGGDRGDL